jgi:hypothetical protein
VLATAVGMAVRVVVMACLLLESEVLGLARLVADAVLAVILARREEVVALALQRNITIRKLL